MNKILIIPDVHGRTFWRKAIEENPDVERIIFLGDYFDPYEYELISYNDIMQGFKDIIELKKKAPEKVILLLGNHDCHYFLPMEQCSRYNMWKEDEYKDLFLGNIDLFSMYHREEIGEKRFIFSHAGILSGWVLKYKMSGIQDEEELCWDNLPDLDSLLINNRDLLGKYLNDVSYYRWGPDSYGSIVWADADEHIRPQFKEENIIQIFGHTQQESDPYILGNHAYCLDCRRAFLINENGDIIDSESKSIIGGGSPNCLN